MCLVKRFQKVRCCCDIWHDGEHIVYISSVERREFALPLKVFFDWLVRDQEGITIVFLVHFIGQIASVMR